MPVLSWLALRGEVPLRCDEPISVMYPLVKKLVVACGWMLAAQHYGVTLTGLQVAVFGTTCFSAWR